MIEEERLQKIISQVANKCGMKKWQYVQHEMSGVIENYFGILIPITIVDTDDGANTLEVFVKIAPNKEEFIKKNVCHYQYETENYVYSTLVPIYKNVAAKANNRINIDEMIPECYYTDMTEFKEVLVLKDMRSAGYNRFDENRFLDYDHVIVSLRIQAQFHALSIVVQESDFKINKDNLKPYTPFHPDEFNIVLKDTLANQLYLFEGTKYENYLFYVINNYDTLLMKSSTTASRLVCGHGDFWRENIMFKYNKDNKPIQACMFDFQTTRLMSPAEDVVYFLMNSVDSNLRREYWQSFLKTYITTLHQTFADNRLDPNKLYTFEDLIHDFKIGLVPSFLKVFMGFWLWLGLEEKALVKSNKFCSPDQKELTLNYFKSTICNILQDLNDFGYISL